MVQGYGHRAELKQWHQADVDKLPGDGSVTLVSLPGHTFGHIGVKIENNGKSLILCSDACFNGRNLSTMTVPGFGFSEKSMLRSLKWLRSEAEKPGCIGVIANHDPDVPEQVIEL